MKQLAVPLCLAIFAGACGAGPPMALTAPSSSPAPSGFRQIAVGQELRTSLEHNDQDWWEFTARSDGTLTVTATWKDLGTVALAFDDVVSSQSNKSPVIGRIQVTVGQRILVKVAQPASWPDGEGWYLPITLSAAME
jgi:hypothetical protein